MSIPAKARRRRPLFGAQMSIPAPARPHLTTAAQHLSAAVERLGDHPDNTNLRMVTAYVWRLAQRSEETT